MKKIFLKNIDKSEYKKLLKRPAIKFDEVFPVVSEILSEVKTGGDESILKFARKFDGFIGDSIKIAKEEIDKSEDRIEPAIKQAIDIAAENIAKFHVKQLPKGYQVETVNGVYCSKEYRPIENIGLYVPGGTAILPSTMLMLGIPAGIAGCKRVVACTPVGKGQVSQVMLYAAKKSGVKEIYTVGGAHAIAMMAFGTESFPKVEKIFGPGNQYVTSAKSLVSIDPEGCAIDMPAGPSEVLIIADESANPRFVAADMLSQAEHGSDSQAICVTTSQKLAEAIEQELEIQLDTLPRKEIAAEALRNSMIIIAEDIAECLQFSNDYAPEHLIIQTERSAELKGEIQNAGSVFIGRYSPESVGDYASGTNHSLPTYGYAKAYSGVSVTDFMKGITFQELTKEGLENISKTVIALAETEKLQAHANAVKVRIENEY